MRRIFSKREKIIFFISVAVVCFALINHFCLRVYLKWMQSLDQEAQIVNEEIDSARLTIRKAGRLENEYQFTIDHFIQKKTDQEMMIELVSDLQEVAKLQACKVTQFKPRHVERKRAVNTFLLDVTLEDDFIDIVSFVYQLQKHPYYFDVREISLSRNFHQKNKNVQVEMVLRKDYIRRGFNFNENQNRATSIRGFGQYRKSLASIQKTCNQKQFFVLASLMDKKVGVPKRLNEHIGKNLKLIGLLIDARPQAIIEDTQSKKIMIVAVGDMIQETLIDEINEDSVLLRTKLDKKRLILQ